MKASARHHEITATEAADRLGLKADTVRKLVQRGLLTPSRKVGQAYLFTVTEIERYSRERSRPGSYPR
jgi:excisionase family DNA binding protein